MATKDKFRMRDIKGNKVLEITVMTAVDENPDLSYLTDEARYGKASPTQIEKYRNQDWERMEAYGVDWWAVGLWVQAEVIIDNVTQTIRSGGLWGIESDSAQGYFEDVAQEEYGQLRDILKKMGFKRIPPFKDADWKEGY